MTSLSRFSNAGRTLSSGLFIALILTFSLQGKAQQILLEKQVPADTTERTFGPNRANYLHGYLALGSLALGDRAGTANELFDQRTDAGFGLLYKRKVGGHLDLGADIQFRRMRFSIDQQDGKQFPDTVVYHRQDIRRGSLPVSLFLRVNYGRRGDYIAKFIDIGAYADLRIYERVVRWEDWGSSYAKLATEGTSYTNDRLYGAFLRAGWNKYSLVLRYRLGPLFAESYGVGDTVPLTLGFQFGFHR